MGGQYHGDRGSPLGSPQRRHAPNGEFWRGEALRRCHISRHTSHGGNRSGHSFSGGGHSIPWSLLYNLAPRHRGSQLRGSHTPTVWVWIATEVEKPYSCHCLQQLEQVYHLEAQATAQAGWQSLKTGCHILNQGGPI